MKCQSLQLEAARLCARIRARTHTHIYIYISHTHITSFKLCAWFLVHLFVYFYSFICLVLFIHIESYREVEIKAERSILSTSHQHPTLASSYLSPTILETQRTFLRCIWATENHQGHQGPAGSMGPTQASHSFALRNPNTSETSSLAG